MDFYINTIPNLPTTLPISSNSPIPIVLITITRYTVTTPGFPGDTWAENQNSMRGNNMRTIDKNTIQSYQDHIYIQEKSQNTIDKYIRDIRTFTAWLETQEQKDITKECVIRYKKHLEAKYMPSSANSMGSSP